MRTFVCFSHCRLGKQLWCWQWVMAEETWLELYCAAVLRSICRTMMAPQPSCVPVSMVTWTLYASCCLCLAVMPLSPITWVFRLFLTGECGISSLYKNSWIFMYIMYTCEYCFQNILKCFFADFLLSGWQHCSLHSARGQSEWHRRASLCPSEFCQTSFPCK